MAKVNIDSMRRYISSSVSSINENKTHGILAEIDLRQVMVGLGFDGRISQGGWIIRNIGSGVFGHHTIVIFPQTIQPNVNYMAGRQLEEPQIALHTICSTMHQIGVRSYYAVPTIMRENDPDSITWHIKQLGIPNIPAYTPLYQTFADFGKRIKPYNFLRYHSDPTQIPVESLPDVFTKEHLRISFQNQFLCEISDIDDILWGQHNTYLVKINEQLSKSNLSIGQYFEISFKDFYLLAFFASHKKTLSSLFFV